MMLSRRGAGSNAAHEALYLYAYPDPGTGGEPWTIGIGHTRAAGLPAVKRGDRVSMARAFEIYATDMAKFENGVRTAVKVPVKQHQFDALVSFHFNTGALRTGSVDDKLNRGDVEGALAVWGQYVNAGGKRMAGLVTRRREEISLFRTGVYPSRRILVRDTPTSIPRQISPDSIPWREDGHSAPQAPVIDIDRPLPPAPAKPRQAASWWSVTWQWLNGG